MAGLNDEQKREVEELVAQNLDILSAFRDLPEHALEQIAADIEKFTYSRAAHLRKPENFYTPRITVGDADLNTDDSGVLRGHAGPTLPRWINFVSGSGSLDPDDFGKVNLNIGGGGADCMFNYLVSTCFASLVGFAEGDSFTTLSGCTVKGFSTVQGAVDQSDTDGRDHSVIFICGGDYSTEDVLFDGTSRNLSFIGAERELVIVGSLTITNGGVVGDAPSRIERIRFTGSNSNGNSLEVAVGYDELSAFDCSFSNPVLFSGLDGPAWFSQNECLDSVTFNSGPTNIVIEKNTFRDFVLISTAATDSCRLVQNEFVGIGGRLAIEGAIQGLTIANNLFDGISIENHVHLFASIKLAGIAITGNTFSAVPSVAYINFDGVSASETRRGACAISGNSFTIGTATVPILLSDQSNVYGVNFSGNSIGGNSSAQYTEDLGGVTVSGNFNNSVFGPNTPPGIATYSVTGSGNLFIPPTSAVGSSTSVASNRIQDDDNDTYVDTEASADSDVIEMASAGTIRARLSALGFQIPNAMDVLLYNDAFSTQVAQWDGATGHIGIGTSISTTIPLNIAKTIANAGAKGASVSLTTSTYGTNIAAALFFSNTGTGGSGTQLRLAGMSGSAVQGGAGAITSLIGVQGAINSTGAGAITDGIVFLASASAWNSDVPATTYAFKAEDIGGTGATAYGIYLPAQTGSVARSFIADDLVIGGTDRSAGATLDVDGSILGDLYKLSAFTELTISSGAVTVTQSNHTIDTESDASSDDLATVNGLTAHAIYRLAPAHDSRSIVLKHDTGNIRCIGGADITLDDVEDWVWGYSPDGSTLDIFAATAATTSARTVTLNIVIDGGGSAITTGIVPGDPVIDFACTIQSATVLADQSGSIVLDIWVEDYANYPPTVADTITASAKPTLSTAIKSQDTTLTGWTTSIAAGDTIRVNVDSATTVEYVTLSLKLLKT